MAEARFLPMRWRDVSGEIAGDRDDDWEHAQHPAASIARS